MSDDCCVVVAELDNTITVVVPAPPEVITIGIQGPPGVQGSPGTGSVISGICGADIALGIAVVLIAGLLYPADPTNAAHAPYYVGVSTEAGSTTDVITVAQLGDLTTSGLTIGNRLFVGLLGVLSTTPVSLGAAWLRYVGTAQSSTSLILVSSISIILG